MASYSNYFINGDTLQNATAVYTDLGMTILAPNGLYSNGVVSREQSATGLGPITICPTCSSVLCEHNIPIDAPTACKTSLDYNMGSTVGAIKVTVYGIIKSVVGIGIKQGSNGFFNTFSSTGESGQTNLAGPDVNALTYFYTDNFKATCSNWVNGIAASPTSPQLETYSYNPTSGSFTPTGVFNSYSFSNRVPSAVLGTTGEMVSYIPSSASNTILEVSAVYPCSPQPLISVSCPTLLYDFQTNLSTGSCTSSFGGVKLVHGKVRGTVDGEFLVGDYIFTTNTLGSGIYNQLTDGSYTGFKANFPAATTNNCSFTVEHGIVTSISDC
mgnify:CR=1 FL=1